MGVIYQISNNIDNRVYIGSTVNYNKRWKEHKRNLLRNNHQNIHLQRFVNKYGIDSLVFDIIETTDNDNILMREQYYLDTIKNKFNIAENASAPMLGKKHTAEAKEKISICSSGSNNPMYGKKRPKWLIDKLIESSLNREKKINEKIIRLINLPNRIEIELIKNDEKIFCFSIAHASKIVGVTQQSISRAMNRNRKSKGWTVMKSSECFYIKSIMLDNLHLFDENCHPQPELIEMLKNLK